MTHAGGRSLLASGHDPLDVLKGVLPVVALPVERGEQGAQRGGWMVEGLRYRDRWESKLLRCARWSPRQ